MLLTKEEFAEKYGYRSAKSVSKLIERKQIILNRDGLINTEDNKEFCENRKSKLKKPKINQLSDDIVQKNDIQKVVKTPEQLIFEKDISSLKLEEHKARVELSKLKVAKEKSESFDKKTLYELIYGLYGKMLKSLAEYPIIYAMDAINVIYASEKPKEEFAKYWSDKNMEIAKQSLEDFEQFRKKLDKE